MNKVTMHQSSRMRDDFDAWAKAQGLNMGLVVQFPGQADHMRPFHSVKTSGAWLAWQSFYEAATLTDKQIDEIWSGLNYEHYPQVMDSKSIAERSGHLRHAFARAVIAKVLGQ